MKSPLPGVNVMLLGASGVGKTYSIRTLVDAGITPFCVFTEPGFEVLGDIPADKLHWHYIAPGGQTWATMKQMADILNKLSFEGITKMSDSGRTQYNQYVQLMGTFNSFVCDRDGKTYGDVGTWGTDRCIVLDGLSGLGTMAMGLIVGGKPVRHQGDWGVAMQLVENLIGKLCTDTQAHFVLIAHTERELDEVQGSSRIMASTLGKKLAPKIPRFFSDVILAERLGTAYTWNTASPLADLKTRNLPTKSDLRPDFAPILENWKKQGGTITPDTE
jgi:hypothetical protein